MYSRNSPPETRNPKLETRSPMSRPLILVSNDDGITAPGILQLVSIARRLGKVVVVAPNSPQSGKGHAITIGDPLRLDHSTLFKDESPDEVEAYECSGTPADCVKLAKHHVLRGRKPDLVVSGINHGSNSSISVLYSGTMSAAIEAAIEGLPAIGFSLCEYGHDADFSHVAPIVEEVMRLALTRGLPPGVALNVNLPKRREGEPIRGIKVCSQANAKWQEDFEERQDPYRRRYYWMNGQFVNFDTRTETDEWALANNYASVVPCQFDLTSASGQAFLNEQWPVNTDPLPDKPAVGAV
jgi:5'-nucleotidase